MKANKTKAGILAVILTVALMLSLFSVCAFAETEAGSASASESVAASASASVTPTASASESGTASGSASASPSATASGTATTAPSATKSAAEIAAEQEKANKRIDMIISLSILAVIIVICVILFILQKEKVLKYLRGLNSERKKIVWFPWNQTVKSTLVVLIVVVICAAAIGLLDFAFSKGLIALGKIFR